MIVQTRFLALLSNASRDVLHLPLGRGLKIKRKPRRSVVKQLLDLHDFPKYELDFLLEDHYQCTDESNRYVYLIEGKWKWKHPRNLDGASRNAIQMASHRSQERFVRALEKRIKLMRLFGEGGLTIPAWFFIGELPEDTGTFYSLSYDFILPRPYSLDPQIRPTLKLMLEEGDLPTRQAYLQLAWNAFDDSYDAHNEKLQFLSLMMALEALFNDGQAELRFRISRSIAVLLGASVEESEIIHRAVKNLYDKRSKLVHTGQCDTLSQADVLELRKYLRRAITELAEANVDKSLLVAALTRAGFGDGRKAIANLASL